MEETADTAGFIHNYTCTYTNNHTTLTLYILCVNSSIIRTAVYLVFKHRVIHSVYNLRITLICLRKDYMWYTVLYNFDFP